MDERHQIVAEYFKLYVLLNKANRHKNEKTELDFEFIKISNNWSFLATLKNSSEGAKLNLSEKISVHKWRPTGFSGLFKLEEHIACILNKEFEIFKISKLDPTNTEQLARLKLQIKKELRSLAF